MHEKVLEIENMGANPRDRSFFPARSTGSKNCAVSKNCANVKGTYLKNLIITKNSRLNHNLDYRFITWCLIPGRIKMPGAKPVAVKNFTPVSSPGLSICTTFRMDNVYWLW